MLELNRERHFGGSGKSLDLPAMDVTLSHKWLLTLRLSGYYNESIGRKFLRPRLECWLTNQIFPSRKFKSD